MTPRDYDKNATFIAVREVLDAVGKHKSNWSIACFICFGPNSSFHSMVHGTSSKEDRVVSSGLLTPLWARKTRSGQQ